MLKRYGLVATVLMMAIGAGARWRRFLRPMPTPAGTYPVPLAWSDAEKIPVIGLAPRLKSIITDPVGLIIGNQKAHGDFFTLRLPTIYDLTILFGAEHYQKILSLPTDHAGVGEVLHRVPTVGFWFPRTDNGPDTLQALIVTGRRIIATLLTPARVSEIPARAAAIAERHSAQWTDLVDLTEVIHPIVYEVTCRYFVGDAVWDNIGERVTHFYRHICDGIDVPRSALAVTPFHYFMPEHRHTRKLYRMLRDSWTDFQHCDSPLMAAINAARLNGQELTHADKMWMFMYVLWNATAYPGAYTYWTLVDVLTHPGVYTHVQATHDQSERLEYLQRCLAESVRMYPVASLVRYLYKPYEFKHRGTTYHIPAGNGVAVVPGALNRDLTQIPDNPDCYDPDRYLRTPAPSLSSFGRGPFGCVAERFSKIVTASIIDQLLSQYSMDIVADIPTRRQRVHQTYPGSPLPVALTPAPAIHKSFAHS